MNQFGAMNIRLPLPYSSAPLRQAVMESRPKPAGILTDAGCRSFYPLTLPFNVGSFSRDT